MAERRWDTFIRCKRGPHRERIAHITNDHRTDKVGDNLTQKLKPLSSKIGR
jgi:hypothetical protein